ncbi:MAG: UDP-N-acetylmuramoyl-L-alanyl-D-glutamate--2,6-diaminopimelate ligase [Lactobacillales bacterium]|nr:UDP-N-acetylmuramoyl-L-alanyl-D-glutamate--2,6-diaminopimelate ligase [Lactobacillales bacterium]
MINIQSDSRKIKKGDIFVALQCEVNDGHKYIDKAIENGASKIIAEYGNYSVETEIVEDTRDYINKYLEENYNKYLEEMTIIGITGTNGKTTSAYLIYQALNKLDIKTAYIGTIGFYLDKKVLDLPNTSVDICDTYNLLMEAYNNGYKTVVLEVSSHALANNRLCTLRFDYGVFTNLTQDHLDFHKTMENYALAKQKLFKMLKDNGKGIINIDDSYSKYFLLDKNINITYGKKGMCSFKNYKPSIKGTNFDLVIEDKNYNVSTKLIGTYNVYNLLVMISILNDMNIDIEDIIAIIPDLDAPNGRMDTVDYKNNKIIIDYAHTPDAIDNIINAVENNGKKYVIFGCTGERDRLKRPIMGKLVSELSDYFIITNDDPHNEDEQQIVEDILKNNDFKNYEVCLDRKEAIRKGINLLKENDILFILGKGHEEFIVGKTKIKHNDKEEVLKYLEEL